jgi:hypothetical protein
MLLLYRPVIEPGKCSIPVPRRCSLTYLPIQHALDVFAFNITGGAVQVVELPLAGQARPLAGQDVASHHSAGVGQRCVGVFAHQPAKRANPLMGITCPAWGLSSVNRSG